MLTRDRALALMHEYTASDALRKHMYAVEIAMRAMAGSARATIPMPGGSSACCTTSTTSGFPTRRTHRPRSIRPRESGILAAEGFPEPLQRAILGHATYTGVARDTPLAKALFAVDELCGFLVACALVRPSRSLTDLEVSSVQEEAQGQGLRPRCESGRRDRRARTSSACRWTSTSHSSFRLSGRTSEFWDWVASERE